MSNWRGMRGIFLCCMLVWLASCSEKKEEVAKYKFYYYPGINMYYDVAAGQYVYSLDSARTWNTVNETSQEKPATLGDGIVIYSDVKQVWKQNETHRIQYNGSVFDIPVQEGEVASAGGEVKERKAAKKQVTAEPEEPKKKGLGKFFNNLFGRKKKKEEQEKPSR